MAEAPHPQPREAPPLGEARSKQRHKQSLSSNTWENPLTTTPTAGGDNPYVSKMPKLTLDTIEKAEGLGLVAHDVPLDAAGILTFAFDPENKKKPPHALIGLFAVRLQRPTRQLTTKECQIVFDILTSLSVITVTKALDEQLHIQWLLKTIMGESPNARGPYNFPEVFQQDAAAISAKVESDLAFEEVLSPSSEPSLPISPVRKSRKGKASPPSTPRPSVPRQLSDMNNSSLRLIMTNITVTDGGSRRSYKLADKSAAIPSNVFGHNGLMVGQWWPLRICALRDGAHGAMQGGIAGGTLTGAFSIVVSRGYEDMDNDQGGVIHYSGSNSHNNEDPNSPILTHHTKALQRSRLDGRPIRVLRTAEGISKWAPTRGIRYDGLYTITEERIEHNVKGGAYLRFRLARLKEQPEIDTSRPTKAEKEAYDRLKEFL